jgi:eukaryotic-like serine/threonine-protein kinase
MIKMGLAMLVFMAVAGVSTYLTVHLLIRSQNTVVVPDLIGKEVVYALELLTDLGLNTKVKGMAFDSRVPHHHIIAQKPNPGDELKRGRDVRLVISRGPRTVFIPNLAGLDLPQASIIIDQNGLSQGLVSHVYHNKIPRGEIVTHDPLPGGFGLRGDAINFLISAGPAPRLIQMMDLTTMGLNQAIDRIERNHLRVGTIAMESHPGLAHDTVVTHTPSAGYPVPKGSPVGLTINRQSQYSDNLPSTQRRLFRYRATQGFLRQQVRVKISQPTASYDIFDAFLKPGQEIWLFIPSDTVGTLFLYVDGALIKSEHFNLE